MIRDLNKNKYQYLLIGVTAVLIASAVQPVLAQMEATSTDPIEETTLSFESTATATTTPESLDSPTEIASTTEPAASTLESEGAAPESQASQEQAVDANGQVEVKLMCSRSYKGPLYDTPSGHYEIPVAASSSAEYIEPQIIGEQAWTLCHDARGHEHEFKITAEEYAGLAISGMPEKSVMESPEEAALDAFPSEEAASEPEEAAPVENAPAQAVRQTASEPVAPAIEEAASTSTAIADTPQDTQEAPEAAPSDAAEIPSTQEEATSTENGTTP